MGDDAEVFANGEAAMGLLADDADAEGFDAAMAGMAVADATEARLGATWACSTSPAALRDCGDGRRATDLSRAGGGQASGRARQRSSEEPQADWEVVLEAVEQRRT
jgi:hypothetical protein